MAKCGVSVDLIFGRLSNKTLKYPVVCNIGKLMPLDTETTVLTMLLSVYHTLPLMIGK